MQARGSRLQTTRAGLRADSPVRCAPRFQAARVVAIVPARGTRLGQTATLQGAPEVGCANEHESTKFLEGRRQVVDKVLLNRFLESLG